jgi:precorrin-2 dehydrogenase / sirohydrochlorin ferrochelatase
MGYYPIYLDMTGRRCLVIGGGAVAERKIAGLLEVGAEPTVVSPAITDTIAGWVKDRVVGLIHRNYQQGDLSDFTIAFVATDDGAVNAQAFSDALRLGVWMNAADDPAHCDFILPSVLRRGDLTVAVSSSGTSPALSRIIREELELYFTEEYALLVKLAAEARDELHERGLSAPFETWRRALSGDVRQLLMRGEIARAKVLLLRELGVEASVE